MNKFVILPILAVIMSGCAIQKPPLSDSQYSAFASLLTVIHSCVVKGYVTPDTGARGNEYAINNLQTYKFDMSILKARVEQVANGINPSQGDCNQLAMQVAQKKNQLDRNNEQAAQEAQAWQNFQNNQNQQKTTYCNKIGTQTICNSY